MSITEKYKITFDRYYYGRFRISKEQYDKAFLWADKNWYKMLPNAQGIYARSIADQIADECKIPYSAGADIANSISISRAT